MKICASIAFLIIGACARGQSARSFFQELYDAGGLDQLASRYVCFPDDGNVRNFWVFNETKLLRKSLIDDGTFSKLPKGVQTELQRDSLIFRGYANGVPLPNQEFLYAENDSRSSWVSEKFMIEKTSARLRFGLSWATLRFKRDVEVLNADGSVQGSAGLYGRCELIRTGVVQRGR
jgi:hypothetical protein